MNPSGRAAASSVSSSARERAGSKWRHAIAAKHESQYHCQRYRPGLGRVYANGTPSRSPKFQLPSSTCWQRSASPVTATASQIARDPARVFARHALRTAATVGPPAGAVDTARPALPAGTAISTKQAPCQCSRGTCCSPRALAWKSVREGLPCGRPESGLGTRREGPRRGFRALTARSPFQRPLLDPVSDALSHKPNADAQDGPGIRALVEKPAIYSGFSTSLDAWPLLCLQLRDYRLSA